MSASHPFATSTVVAAGRDFSAFALQLRDGSDSGILTWIKFIVVANQLSSLNYFGIVMVEIQLWSHEPKGESQCSTFRKASPTEIF
jgi:hypothetical protein